MFIIASPENSLRFSKLLSRARRDAQNRRAFTSVTRKCLICIHRQPEMHRSFSSLRMTLPVAVPRVVIGGLLGIVANAQPIQGRNGFKGHSWQHGFDLRQ